MISFSHGGTVENIVPEGARLAYLIETADPEFWNGVTGMSAFTYRGGKLDQTLYLSLDPALGYYLLLEYTDRSRIYATAAVPAGPGPGLIWWGGERIELPAERFVSSAEAHRAIAWFLETGDADPDTNWELF